MPHQETSYEAWQSIQEKLNDKQRVVLWAFKSQGDMTDEELAAFLGWPINRVTPRRGELVVKGLLRMAGTKISSTGRRVIIWGAA